MAKSPKIKWDAHGCFPLKKDSDLSGLKRYKKAGVSFLSINIGMDFNPLHEIVEVVARFRHFISNHREYVLADSIATVKKAKASKKLAIAFDLEGAVMLQDNVNMVSFFYDLGVRQMLLAYNKDNSLAGGCRGQNIGLSQLGRSVIQEMNRVGMVVDVSHMSQKASFEAMETSNKPVVFSHSNAKTLCSHPRNITDEQIKACASQNGVVGVNGIGIFLNQQADTSTASLVEHIDHMVQLVGPRHVGIGLDYVVDKQEMIDFLANNPDVYQNDANRPEDMVKFAEPEQWKEIPAALKKLGYSQKAIDQIMGENFFRIAQANWV